MKFVPYEKQGLQQEKNKHFAFLKYFSKMQKVMLNCKNNSNENE